MRLLTTILNSPIVPTETSLLAGPFLRPLIYTPSHSIPARECFLLALRHELRRSQEALLEQPWPSTSLAPGRMPGNLFGSLELMDPNPGSVRTGAGEASCLPRVPPCFQGGGVTTHRLTPLLAHTLYSPNQSDYTHMPAGSVWTGTQQDPARLPPPTSQVPLVQVL